MKTIDDVAATGKRVLMRADLNVRSTAPRLTTTAVSVPLRYELGPGMRPLSSGRYL